jgi:hypothetical protein
MMDRKEILKKLNTKFVDHEFNWSTYSGGALGICPFHEDKDPSFSVYKVGVTWRYHCFGCGRSGVISELLDLESDINSEISDALSIIDSLFSTDAVSGEQQYDLSFTRPWDEDEEIVSYLTETRSVAPDILTSWNTRFATVLDEKLIYFPDKWWGESYTNMYQRKPLTPSVRYKRYWTSLGTKSLFHIDTWNSKLLILVEGVIDAMRMYPYAVPVLQKGLTEFQESQLLNRFEEVGYPEALIILFDGGCAESVVSWRVHKRISKILLGKTIVGVGRLPNGKDPADVGLQYLVDHFDIVHLGRFLKRGGSSWLRTLL